MAAIAELQRRFAAKLAPPQWRVPDTWSRIQQLKERACACNIVLEVRDARLPMSSAIKELYTHILSWKQHLIVLNKCDLADPGMLDHWKRYFHRRQENYVFVNSTDIDSVKRMARVVKASVLDVLKHERSTLVMICGLPNVGKSELSNTLHRVGRYNISALEKLTLAKVGPEPYVTKDIRGYKINYRPIMYVLDTPSVIHSGICDPEQGMKLALCGAMEDDVVGEEQLARYLLVLWNTQPSLCLEKWIERYRIREFARRPRDTHNNTDRAKMRKGRYSVEVKGILSSMHLDFSGDINNEDDMEMLIDQQLYELRGFYQTTRATEVTSLDTAKRLLRLYRTGMLGRFTLDPLPASEQMSDQTDVPDVEIELPEEVDVPKKKERRRKRSLLNSSPDIFEKFDRVAKERFIRKIRKHLCRGDFIY